MTSGKRQREDGKHRSPCAGVIASPLVTASWRPRSSPPCGGVVLTTSKRLMSATRIAPSKLVVTNRGRAGCIRTPEIGPADIPARVESSIDCTG